MAHWYVKTGGTATTATATATTDPNTQRTGAWSGTAGDHFADIVTCLLGDDTVAPAAGDFIYCSSTHAATYTTAQTYILPDNITIISVDNSNQDQYLAGATETVNNGGATLDLTITASNLNHNATFYGMTLEAEDRVVFDTDGHRILFANCTWHSISTASLKGMLTTKDGIQVIFRNSEINFSGAGHEIQVGYNANFVLDNCTSTGTAATNLFDLAGNGRCVLEVINTNLDQLIAGSGSFVDAGTTSDDGVLINISRCKLPTGFSVAASWGFKGQIVNMTECDQTDGYHYFYHETNEGTMEEDLVTYLNATYDGTTGFSAKCTATADASPMNPLRFKLGTIPAQNLATAQTVTVECTSDASLTDNDIWIEIVHNNNTDEALGDVVTTQNTDPLAAGTALTTAGTGTWTSGDTEDYIITKDLGALTNVDNGNVTVYACIGAASVVANFDLPTIAAT